MKYVLWYLRRLQKSYCLAADLLLLLSLNCGFTHGDSPTPWPLASQPPNLFLPITKSLNLTGMSTSPVCHCQTPRSFFSIHHKQSALFPEGEQSAIIRSFMLCGIFSIRLVCAVPFSPPGGLFLTCCTPQVEKQTPKWTLGACPCPLPGRSHCGVY